MLRHQDVSAQQEAQPAARFFEAGEDRSELRIAQSRKRAPQIYRDEEDTIRSAQAMNSRHGPEGTRITSPRRDRALAVATRYSASQRPR